MFPFCCSLLIYLDIKLLEVYIITPDFEIVIFGGISRGVSSIGTIFLSPGI